MEKKSIFNKKRQEIDECRETFFTEVTGNRLKNHYARNILYKSLSKSSYSVSSVDLSDIKNTLLKY